MSAAASSSQQPATTTLNLTRFLSERYASVREQHPGEGRRRWRLRVAQEFWTLTPAQRAEYASVQPLSAAEAEASDFTTDDDPLDSISTDAPGVGILLRTDFANEDAWQAFHAKLQEAEHEFAPDAGPDSDHAGADTESMAIESAPEDVDVDVSSQGIRNLSMEDAGIEEGGEDGEAPAGILHVVNDPAFAGLSNLGALRLLNDVEVRRTPLPPPGTARVKPPNRLVDCDGWQEVYVGKMVWIYDARSNTDQCVRLVSQQGAMYGTATGDSWRARVSHICELQVNLASGAMTIDFGGIDRWDYPERVRNMEEANRPL